MAEKTTTVYDPDRQALVDVPESQVKALEAVGFKSGPEAELLSRENGWEGKVAATLLGVAHSASFGTSDLLIPKSLRTLADQVNEMHPALQATGEFAGTIPRTLNPVSNILGSAVQGGLGAVSEASKHSHPISAERVLQGALWDGAWATLGEGFALGGKAVAPGLKNGLKKLARVVPREVPEGMSPAASAVLRDQLPAAEILPEGLKKTLRWAGPKGQVVAGAADAIPALINHLDVVNKGIDKIVDPMASGVGATMKTLLSGAAAVINKKKEKEK